MTDTKQEGRYAHTYIGTKDELDEHLENLGAGFAYEDVSGELTGFDADVHEWRVVRANFDDSRGLEVILSQRSNGGYGPIPQHVDSAPLIWTDDGTADLLLDEDGVKEQMRYHFSAPSNDDGWRVTDLGPVPEVFDALNPHRKAPTDDWTFKPEAPSGVTSRTTSADGQRVFTMYDPRPTRPDLVAPEVDELGDLLDHLWSNIVDGWANIVGIFQTFFHRP